MGSLKPHKFAELLPRMSDAEYASLKADIERNGQQDPIWLFDGKILDGRHRNEVMVELKREPKLKEFKGTESEAFAFVCSKSIHRNMSESQKAAAAVSFLPHFEKQAICRMKLNGKELVPDSMKGQSRDFAGQLFGVSGRYVSDAQLVFERNPKLFKDVFEGRLPLSRAKRVVYRATKRDELAAKAKLAPTTGAAQIIHGDCVKEMEIAPSGKFRLIFADSPYNMGIDYGRGKKADELPREKFHWWCNQWMDESYRILTPDGSLWVLINDENAAEFKIMIETCGFSVRSWIKWYETFGINCPDNFNRTSRHLFYCVKDERNYVFNHDAFARPSDRQTKYKDLRAAEGGKMWDDIWQIPRLVENCKERVPGFPTQLPLALVEPIVLGCSEPGDLVFDPFTGSGTTAVAAVLNGRKFVGTELSEKFAEMARLRVRAAIAESKSLATDGHG